MDEENRKNPSEVGFEEEKPSDFGYMNDLLHAYGEALRKKKAKQTLSEERKAYVLSAQRRVKAIAASIAERAAIAEIKELAFMAKESADQCMTAIGGGEEESETARDYAEYPLPSLLARCVLLANRALNALVRTESGNERAIALILSELSALYAIAAIR